MTRHRYSGIETTAGPSGTDDERAVCAEALEEVITEAVGMMVEHVRKRNADVVWTPLVAHCAAAAQRWRKVRNNDAYRALHASL